MKVISALAAIDFRVGSISREGNTLVVASRPGEGIATQVYVRPKDALEVLKAICRSPSALRFCLLFPLYWWRARREPVVAPHRAANNPWQ